MKLDFEYGHGLLSANLPDSTDAFVPGTTVPDPEYLPQTFKVGAVHLCMKDDDLSNV